MKRTSCGIHPLRRVHLFNVDNYLVLGARRNNRLQGAMTTRGLNFSRTGGEEGGFKCDERMAFKFRLHICIPIEKVKGQ